MDKKDLTRQVFGEALAEYGTQNKKVVVLVADVSSSVMTGFFEKKCPDRFFNVGIAEAGMVDTAVGFALAGMVPFVNTFAFLFTRAGEQISTCVAYARTNVKLVGGFAGISNFKDGPTHHAINDVALMRMMPNMVVLVPADSVEARKMIPLAAEHDGPVYIRISRETMPVIFDENHTIEIGKGVQVLDGRDVTIIANGHLVSRSLEAAAVLKQKGIQARVVNMYSVKPLDLDLVRKCVEETGALVTAEEHTIIGGLGGAVAEMTARYCPAPIEMVGIADKFAETATSFELLMDHCGMSVADIVMAAERAIARKC
jgi:transketolase